MAPETIGLLYKQYCQSILRYSMDNLFISESKLNELNTRQNVIVKRTIGINRFCRMNPINGVLGLESVKISLTSYMSDNKGLIDSVKFYFRSIQLAMFTHNQSLTQKSDSIVNEDYFYLYNYLIKFFCRVSYLLNELIQNK
ncbi:hypothetical protein BpHYR1_018232 [Brachionus plicatilis]|uniref:RNA-directed DNA polymerase from mobile element jockey-like n=1 Tax=Brachionus plicatilis TaxID=10195 RepID=A0A3M7QWB0_BRAPC|nr:hypothetical protein BpHYR1_018232 [Brachionus plicatilis]